MSRRKRSIDAKFSFINEAIPRVGDFFFFPNELIIISPRKKKWKNHAGNIRGRQKEIGFNESPSDPKAITRRNSSIKYQARRVFPLLTFFPTSDIDNSRRRFLDPSSLSLLRHLCREFRDIRRQRSINAVPCTGPADFLVTRGTFYSDD